MTSEQETQALVVAGGGEGGWTLAGPAVSGFGLVNDYLGYLADRCYSPRTVRSYAFDLLHFCRWLVSEEVALAAVSTDVLLRYLAACRTAVLAGQDGGNVVDLRSGRSAGYEPATGEPSAGGDLGVVLVQGDA
jgi:hypothetical protein